MKKYHFLLFYCFLFPFTLSAQCKVIKGTSLHFNYDNHSYDLVKNPKNWLQASKCAVVHGGYLAEINSKAEQDAIFKVLKNQANIKLNSTMAPDGGGASYVWLGGNDISHEGKWIWDGNNDGKGIFFWEGGVDGHPVKNYYTNWGREPDNYNGVQNALGLALTEWPRGLGNLGHPGQWNDLNENNQLYYLIEYNHL